MRSLIGLTKNVVTSKFIVVVVFTYINYI